jgi:hypothetical protein
MPYAVQLIFTVNTTAPMDSGRDGVSSAVGLNALAVIYLL